MVPDSPWPVRGAADGVGVAVPGDEVLEAWSMQVEALQK